MKKSAKVPLYFGLDCGMFKFFTLKPQSKIQLMSLPNFWSTVRRKRSRFEHMQTVIRTSRMIRGLFEWSGSELGSCFKYSALKLKNQKHIAVDVLLKTYPMVPLSCRSNLAGRYLNVGGGGGFKRGGGGTQHAVLVQHLFQCVFSQGRQESKHMSKGIKNRCFFLINYGNAYEYLRKYEGDTDNIFLTQYHIYKACKLTFFFLNEIQPMPDTDSICPRKIVKEKVTW